MDKSSQYKIFSDPIHGFITVPKGIILRLIDHPYVQRLRRIRQLGLGYLVFPAAEHSRFSHALGALELCQRVLRNIKEKDTTISDTEITSTLIAILLHDVGHGPFSHSLEHTLINDFNHEQMSLKIMQELNKQFEGELETTIQIFTDQYPKKFLHQLISSQLDIDRLDYLKRDSFFIGVSEGSVGINRILKTMRVFNGNVVIEKKGIYAIENYILSRRLMYMQVYLHKTVLSADSLLKNIFKRVEYLIDNGEKVDTPSKHLGYFVSNKPSAKKAISDITMVHYMALDDHDVMICIKNWAESGEPILKDLSYRFINRDLYRTTFLSEKEIAGNLNSIKKQTRAYLKKRGLPHDDHSASYYYDVDKSFSEAYKYQSESIWILEGKKKAIEFSKAADTRHIIALTQPVVKPYIVHLKDVNC